MGYIRRKSKELVTPDFLDFVQEKEGLTEEEEEKIVIREVINILEDKLRLTDGLLDSEEIFEERLDKILFAPPNQRKTYIQENLNDMTDGFVEYVQRELKSIPDTDSKVVLASVLQLIGQLKKVDVDESSLQGLLKKADATLGELVH